MTSAEKQQVSKQGTQNPEAYELYTKGRYAWSKRTITDLQAAVSYFNHAIEKDSGYALAYAGLADVYSVMATYGGMPSETFPKSNAAVRKALELDPTLAHPHAVLGANLMEYEWDFPAGLAEYKKALELDPQDTTARLWYAEDLAFIGGHEDEAVQEIDRASQTDPLSPLLTMNAGDVRVIVGRFNEAIPPCQRVTQTDPTFARSHWCLLRAYWGKGDHAKVVEEYKRYAELANSPNESQFAEALERGFQAGGWKAALTKGIDALLQQRKTGYASPFEIATCYADLGDKDKAFEWLNTAYRERDFLIEGLPSHFLLKSLHSDPRYGELVKKIGFPQ